MSDFTMADISGDADPKQMLEAMKKYASKTELKPCPFCDSKNIETHEPTIYEPDEESEVECQNPLCGATVRGITSKMAIAKWNRRAKE